mmetsp:Transcript_20365/g.51274  ORF Transcript_20365/g.51274 Transcript_20365/m.51274 type:complete len:359 (-) Transcript_20365:135-1211(-)
MAACSSGGDPRRLHCRRKHRGRSHGSSGQAQQDGAPKPNRRRGAALARQREEHGQGHGQQGHAAADVDPGGLAQGESGQSTAGGEPPEAAHPQTRHLEATHRLTGRRPLLWSVCAGRQRVHGGAQGVVLAQRVGERVHPPRQHRLCHPRHQRRPREHRQHPDAAAAPDPGAVHGLHHRHVPPRRHVAAAQDRQAPLGSGRRQPGAGRVPRGERPGGRGLCRADGRQGGHGAAAAAHPPQHHGARATHARPTPVAHRRGRLADVAADARAHPERPRRLHAGPRAVGVGRAARAAPHAADVHLPRAARQGAHAGAREHRRRGLREPGEPRAAGQLGGHPGGGGGQRPQGQHLRRAGRHGR